MTHDPNTFTWTQEFTTVDGGLTSTQQMSQSGGQTAASPQGDSEGFDFISMSIKSIVVFGELEPSR